MSVTPGINQRRRYPIQGPGPRSRSSNPTRRALSPRPAHPAVPRRGSRHRRVDPRLVDENQPFCLDSPHLRPVSPPLGLYFGSIPLAGMQGLLLVGQAEAAEGDGSRVQAKPPHSFSCFRVASGCLAIRTASRTRSGKPRAGRGPPSWGLRVRVPASRRLWTNRVMNETLTRNRLAT